MSLGKWKYSLTDEQRIVLGQCLKFCKLGVRPASMKAYNDEAKFAVRIAEDQIDYLINLFDVGEIE